MEFSSIQDNRLKNLNTYYDEQALALIHLVLIMPNADRADGIDLLGDWLSIRPKIEPFRVANHVLQGYAFSYLGNIRMHLRVSAGHMNLLYFLYQLHWMDFNIMKEEPL